MSDAIKQSEIAIELATFSATLRVYDRNGQALVPFVGDTFPNDPTLVDLSRKLGRCDEFINFYKPGSLGSSPNETIAYDNTQGARGPITLEISTGFSTQRLVYNGSIDYCMEGGRQGNFLCPSTIAAGGDSDALIVVESSRLRVSPIYMWSTPDFVDEAIGGDDWVLPYHLDEVCGHADVTCSTTTEYTNRLFLMPVDQVLDVGSPLTKRIASSLTLPSAGGYDWTEDWLTLAFAPSTGLTIESQDFAADGLTFTASDAAQGWGGVRVTGGTATLAGQSAVEGAGITVTSGALTLDRAVVRNAPGSGIYASGSASQVTAQNLSEISDSGTYGVYATNGADVTLQGGSRILRSGFYGIRSRGSGTNVTVYDAEIIGNSPYAVITDYYGEVDLDHAFGFANVFQNPSSLDAETAATFDSGAGGGHRIVKTSGSQGYDAFVLDAAYADARQNYWGQGVTSSSDLELEESGGILLVDPVRTTDPAASGFGGNGALMASQTMTTSTGEALPSGPYASALGTGTVEGWVEAAEDAADTGDALAAVDAATRAVDWAASDGERRMAWAAAARLAVRLQAWEGTGGPAAWTRLAATARAALADPDDGPWARRALALAAASSDAPGARAESRTHIAALLADAPAATAAGAARAPLSHAAFARLLGLRLALDEGDVAGALIALSGLAAVDPAEAEVAADEVGAVFPDADVAGTLQSAAQSARLSAEAAGVPEGAALAVAPNPTPGPARLSYAVSATAEVELTIYDGLGRRVAVVAEGTRGAGGHTETVDLGAFAAGIYLARLVVHTGDGSGAGVVTRRFTVVR